MRHTPLALLVLLSACAARTVPPLPGPTGPGADPARVADGFSVSSPEAARADITMRTRLGSNTLTAETFHVPAGVAHRLEFCDTLVDGKTVWTSAHWYLVRINAVDQQNAGPVEATTLNCYRTPQVYSFDVGSYAVDVLLVNHCDAGSVDPLCVGYTVDVYGQSTPIVAVATSAGLSGPPPSIVNGQVLR